MSPLSSSFTPDIAEVTLLLWLERAAAYVTRFCAAYFFFFFFFFFYAIISIRR